MLKCAVIGSVNMDMVVRVDKFPKPGETRTGDSFSVVPGGKGANQAVALGRLGGDVAMAGCIGFDASGDTYIENFKANNVDISAFIFGAYFGLIFQKFMNNEPFEDPTETNDKIQKLIKLFKNQEEQQ